MNLETDVAIVGMACIFPQAPNLRRYWANNVNGIDAIIDRPAGRWREHTNWRLPPDHEAFLPCEKAGYLEDGILFDPIRFGVVPNLVKHGDPDQFLMLEVIDQALRDARIAEDAPVREKTDVIIGRGGYATGKLIELSLRAELYEDFLEILDRKYPEMFAGRRSEVEAYLRSTLTPPSIDNVSTAVSNIAASRPANRFNLRGAAYVVDGACASSLIAVETAVWRLRTRQSDMAVAAGMFVNMTPTFFHVFTRLGAISRNQMIRPFDRRADGLMVGEGGGAIILKRLEDAIANGDAIYSVIRGVGSSSDGLGLDVLAPNSEGQILAIERAYADAGIDRMSIGYLECHGTGTDAGDAAEIASVKHCFGTTSTPATARAMGSVKSMIGHTMPAAGMAAIIRVAMSLSNKIIPPSLHCEQPREDMADAPFYINTQSRPWVQATSHGSRRAGINAFGFGGVNVHVVMEETPQASPTTSVRGFDPVPRPLEAGLARETELAVFAAPSVAEMDARLARFQKFLDADVTEPALADLCYSLAQELDTRLPVKLALIAPTIAELRARMVEARDGMARGDDFEKSENIYFSTDAAKPKGKIAFVLPGMGFPGLIGSYPDHLLELCMHYPEIREEFDFFEDRDRHPGDVVPTSSIFCPPASLPEEYRKQLKGRLAPPKADSDLTKKTSPHERFLSAMGVTLANWVSWILLRKFKIPVDMMTGQSQGEMAAVCACGVSDFRETAPSFWKMLDLDTRDRLGGRLAFAWATGARLEELVAQHPGTYVAIYMAPTGTIFGGDREGLEKICEILREDEVLVQILPYPPIHTPSLTHLRNEMMEKLEEDNFELCAPKIPLYSSITAGLYPTDADGIKEHLLYNIDRPLRIWQTIQAMYRDGARVFVQVGGGHMAAHLEVLLPDDAEPVTTAATDTDTRNPITQLNHLCATLITAGVSMDLTPLFEYRPVRSLDFDAPTTTVPKKGLQIPLRIDWLPIYSENVPPRHAAEPASTGPAVELPPATTVESAPAPARSKPPVAEAPAGNDLRSQLPFDEAVLARLPVLGEVLDYVPGEAITIRRILSLETDPYLADHLFVYAPPKTVEECLPVLPMTMSIEFLAETGSLLAPGEGLIGFEGIRAMRWIGLKDVPTEDLRIEARVVSFDEATAVRRIEAKFYASDTLSFQATVLFSSAYRQDLRLDIVDSSQDGPWPIDASQIYSERYMFHGPAFHVMTELDTFGNPGASAKLEVLPKERLFPGNPDPILLTDPCLMDGIGQIVGLWSMFQGVPILPCAADRIEIYGPTPPVGTRTPIRMECVHLSNDTRQIRCHVEIFDGEGNLWVRVQNWTEWLMHWSNEYLEATRMPIWFALSTELPLPGLPDGSVCMQLDKEHLAGPDAEWVTRIFLHTTEVPEVMAISGNKKKREVLRNRIAVKDAARIWIARQQQSVFPYPCEFIVGHDDKGAPRLEPADDPGWPYLSVSHSDGATVALAASVPVGIDVEPESRDVLSIVDQFLGPGEQERLAPLADGMPDEAWPLRFWCAKEAVGKMLGTGLEGRPKQFEVVDVAPTGAVVIRHRETGRVFEVQTLRWNGWVYAYIGESTPNGGNSAVALSAEGQET